MSLCFSGKDRWEATRDSRRIDRMLKKEKRRVRSEIKILFLGAGESGKSTLMKQMKIIHGDPLYDPSSVDQIRHIVYQNILKGIKVLLDARDKFSINWEDSKKVFTAVNLISRADTKNVITPEYFGRYVLLIECIWNDAAIRTTYERRSWFQLSDGFIYLMKNLKRISSGNYLPTNTDILHSRAPTKSVFEYRVEIKRVPFLFIDVGGQRAQRRRWYECLDNITSILFLVSSIEYDQVLVEDRRRNRLDESLAIFQEIVNHKSFNRASFILFLNKTDLLREKLKSIRERKKSNHQQHITFDDTIDRHFHAFRGDATDLKDVQQFLLESFDSRCHVRGVTLYSHFTTAVDTENIKYVFNDVRATVLRQNIHAIMLQ